MGVRRVGVNDIIVEFLDQFANPQAGRQVDFSPHFNRENLYTGSDRPLSHRGSGLTDQMAGNPALCETRQQIQCLLLPASPGALGVDVQDIHVAGFWILDSGYWMLVTGNWLLVTCHLPLLPDYRLLFKYRLRFAFPCFCIALFNFAVCL